MRSSCSPKVTHSTGIHGTFDPPGNWLKPFTVDACDVHFIFTLKGLAVKTETFVWYMLTILSNLTLMNDGGGTVTNTLKGYSVANKFILCQEK